MDITAGIFVSAAQYTQIASALCFGTLVGFKPYPVSATPFYSIGPCFTKGSFPETRIIDALKVIPLKPPDTLRDWTLVYFVLAKKEAADPDCR